MMTVINLLILNKLVVYFSGLFNPQKYLQAIQEYKVCSDNVFLDEA